MIDLTSFSKTLDGKAVAVYGLGKSGLSVARALCAARIAVYAYDDDTQKLQMAIAAGCKALSPDYSQLSMCKVLVLAPGIPLNFPSPHPVVTVAHEQNVEVIGDIELFTRCQVGHKTIGITGTNGKSTTTALIAHTLNFAGQPAIACGNIGTPIFDLTLNDQNTILVIELSSFQLDLCPTFTPDIAVHINITPDHLDRHGTLENYVHIKEKIFNGIGIGFCGVDDDPSQGMFRRTQKNNNARRMIPVSCQHAINDGLSLSGTDIADDVFEGGIIGSLSSLPTLRGQHNYQNALMTYGVARALGLEPKTIFSAFFTYPGLPHRQITVRTIEGVEYINDSKATNAAATEKALLTFKNIYWIVGGLPKAGGLSGLEPHAARVRHAYLIGSSATDFARFMTENKIAFTVCNTIENAVYAAHTQAQSDTKNDQAAGVVLLSPACASYDQFKSYEHRGEVFTLLVNKLNHDLAQAS